MTLEEFCEEAGDEFDYPERESKLDEVTGLYDNDPDDDEDLEDDEIEEDED